MPTSKHSITSLTHSLSHPLTHCSHCVQASLHYLQEPGCCSLLAAGAKGLRMAAVPQSTSVTLSSAEKPVNLISSLYEPSVYMIPVAMCACLQLD